MEASASAPLHPDIEPEPPGWQPRALWLNARMLCGSISFFFVSFVFAYFYLRALDTNNDWKIGHVSPPAGYGVAIMVLFVLSGIIFRFGRGRPAQTVILSTVALVLGLVAVILQIIEYTAIGFGPTNGGYASVFIGWTSLYAVVALIGLVWIEIQVASLWRLRREGVKREVREGVPSHDEALLQSGLEGCSFYWAYFVAIGFIAWVILYLL